MKSIPIFLLACFLLLPNSVSLAQAQQQPQRVPDGGTREVLISILIPSLPNAPFTATVNTGWIRQLPDGSTITLKNHRAIARDAAGRMDVSSRNAARSFPMTARPSLASHKS